MDSYIYTPVSAAITADDILFHEYRLADGRKLRLAHFILSDGLRLEVSEIRHYPDAHHYSVMRIEKDDSRDWYLLQESKNNVADIINQCFNQIYKS